MFLITCGLAHALCAVQFFSFLFLFPFLPQPVATPRHGKFASSGNVLLAGCAERSEMSVLHPVQNARTSFVLKLTKKPFSIFLLSNFVFLYFSATLEAFALTASRSLRASRAGQSAQAVRDFIIPQFFIHLFFNVCTP